MRDLRAISLDARSLSPSHVDHATLKSSSPSQASLFFPGSPSNLLHQSSPRLKHPPLLLPPRSEIAASSASAAPPR
jgi:hypothetical protein